MLGMIAFLLLAIAGVGVVVYFFIYSHKINEKIASGEIEGRRLIDIPNLIRTAIISAVLFFVLSIIFIKVFPNKQKTVEGRSCFSVIDLSDYSRRICDSILADTDFSFVQMYSRESNAGFQKNVVQEGAFTFTAFTRIGAHSVLRPDFFCFVDYTGEDEDELYFYEHYEYIDFSPESGFGAVGLEGGSFKGGFLVIGNIIDGKSLKISLALLDEKGHEAYLEALEKGEDDPPSETDFALHTGNIVITVQ